MSQNVGNLAQNFSVDSEYYPSIYEAATLPRINESEYSWHSEVIFVVNYGKNRYKYASF